MTKNTGLYIRIADYEKQEWERAAEADGLNLSEWIRGRCNADNVKQEASIPKPTDLATDRPATRKAVAEASTPCHSEVAAPVRSQKVCEHGTSRGYHCWQCRGLAVA